jgi:biopolymer transport protein ExbB
MFDTRRLKSLIAALGALTLLTAAPAAMAQPEDPAAAEAEAPADEVPAPAPAPAPDTSGDPESAAEALGAESGELTPWGMFVEAVLVVKVVMIGLIIASAVTWIILFLKLFEFAALGRVSNRFVEAFRSAKSIGDMGKIAMSEDFDGNPLADMAAAAAQEVELSRQAGLAVSGEHRETTLERAAAAVHAVQSSLGKRLAGGMQFLASTGSTSPFVGLFGTVYGIMNSFIGIANSGTTNLAAVAPGISEALLATGIGLFAAIPAVVMYNYFQTRISAFGARTEGFIAELMNAISRQLDKGA